MISSSLLVKLAASDVAMFRFLLEAYENLAFFTVLERQTALLKLSFCEESRACVIDALGDIKRTVPLSYERWPIFPGEEHMRPQIGEG